MFKLLWAWKELSGGLQVDLMKQNAGTWRIPCPSLWYVNWGQVWVMGPQMTCGPGLVDHLTAHFSLLSTEIWRLLIKFELVYLELSQDLCHNFCHFTPLCLMLPNNPETSASASASASAKFFLLKPLAYAPSTTHCVSPMHCSFWSHTNSRSSPCITPNNFSSSLFRIRAFIQPMRHWLVRLRLELGVRLGLESCFS